MSSLKIVNLMSIFMNILLSWFLSFTKIVILGFFHLLQLIKLLYHRMQ